MKRGSQDVADGSFDLVMRTGGSQYEERGTVKTNKGILKCFEALYLNEDSSGYDNAKKMLMEAFKLAGIHNEEPTESQINTFLKLNDTDRDGQIGNRDIEERLAQFCTSETNYVSAFKSQGHSLSPRQSEKEMLRRSAREKMTDKGLNMVMQECYKCFQDFDKASEGHIEYEHLIPLLGEAYQIFGVSFRPSPADARRYIEIIDTDKDGVIGWEDFELFVLKALGTTMPQNNSN